MLYKIINNIVDVDFDIHIPVTHHYTRDHLMQPYTRMDAYKYSFIPSAIRLWNTLPRNLVNQESFEHKKFHTYTYTLTR